MSDNRKTYPMGTKFRVVLPLRRSRLNRAGVGPGDTLILVADYGTSAPWFVPADPVKAAAMVSDGGPWGCASLDHLVPVSDETASIPADLARAFVSTHAPSGYNRGNEPEDNIASIRARIRQHLMAAGVPDAGSPEIESARRLLTEAGFTVTKAAA